MGQEWGHRGAWFARTPLAEPFLLRPASRAHGRLHLLHTTFTPAPPRKHDDRLSAPQLPAAGGAGARREGPQRRHRQLRHGRRHLHALLDRHHHHSIAAASNIYSFMTEASQGDDAHACLLGGSLCTRAASTS